MHNVLKDFELRPPLSTTTFELLLQQFEVSSRCSHGDMIMSKLLFYFFLGNFCMQVYTEFQLMCGEQAIKTIQDNWRKYVPALLEQAVPTPPAELDEEDQLKAVEAIDKRLRPSGAGSKTTAAFAIFKVPYIASY